MHGLITKLIPILLLFFLGMALRRLGLLGKAGADGLLRLVAYVGIPALTLVSIARAELHADFALLALAAALTVVVTSAVAWGVGRLLRLARPTLGVFVIGPSIMNLAAEYPFVLAAWGQEGFAQFVFMDLGNAMLVLTYLYALAAWFGGHGSNGREILKRIMVFPPIWALGLAIALNLGGIELNAVLADGLHAIGSFAVMLVMVALGIYFEPRRIRSAVILVPIALRVALGLVLAYVWIELLDLDGLTRTLVLFGSVAPIGFNTLVFASLEELDEEFAASIVSLSLLLALLYLPVVLLLLSG